MDNAIPTESSFDNTPAIVTDPANDTSNDNNLDHTIAGLPSTSDNEGSAGIPDTQPEEEDYSGLWAPTFEQLKMLGERQNPPLTESSNIMLTCHGKPFATYIYNTDPLVRRP
ncbi:MAG: hypothetical protein Q9169_007711 [Polycauliona sp. 2 TL-2023]